MEGTCPQAGIWVSWAEHRLGPGERERLSVHLAACPACRQDLASLSEAVPEALPEGLAAEWAGLIVPRRGRIPYALAAAGILAVAGLWLWKGREAPPESVSRPLSPKTVEGREARLPAPGVSVAANGLEEWVLGSTAEAALAPLSRGGIVQDGRFRLEAGRAWVESSGETVKVSLSGWDGTLEVSEGAVALAVRPERVSLLMGEAWAGEEGWGITVIRGKARAGERTLSAGESLGSGAPKEDFRGWKALTKAEGALRDSVRTLLQEGGPPSWTAEFQVRKKQPEAEGALLFRSGGRGWEVPLGAYLPSSGSARLRLEVSSGRARLLAGGRQVFSGAADALAKAIYPSDTRSPLAFRAWGGDLEIREARWRP